MSVRGIYKNMYLYVMPQVKIKTGERETTISRNTVRNVIISIKESGRLKEGSKSGSVAKSTKNGKSNHNSISRRKK